MLKKYPQWVVTIEGHCDERGTAEYNLALGERRAVAVKTYMVSLGVAPDRVRTVSYGKEFPFDQAHTEEGWSRNRRAHFVITQVAGARTEDDHDDLHAVPAQSWLALAAYPQPPRTVTSAAGRRTAHPAGTTAAAGAGARPARRVDQGDHRPVDGAAAAARASPSGASPRAGRRPECDSRGTQETDTRARCARIEGCDAELLHRC